MRAKETLDRLAGSLRRGVGWGELYHAPQPLGGCFRPNEVYGYFIDLSAKAEHRGRKDTRGIPLSQGPGRVLYYHPTVVNQNALGHHDLWLKSGIPRHQHAFMAASDWLLEAQDVMGGWRCFNKNDPYQTGGLPIGLPHGWNEAASPYSGMSQGQAISVLVRAHRLTGDQKYSEAASRAFDLLTLAVSRGGVCEEVGGFLSIEEVPARPRNTILNGWIFAMLGAWDFWLDSHDSRALFFFERNLESLLRRLESFDLGWWSLYDERGHISKPFYHKLHVAQLLALSMLTPRRELEDVIHKWRAELASLNSVQPLGAYALQWQVRLLSGKPFRLRRGGGG